MENIEMLIGELESEILKAKRATFSTTDVVVNRAVMLDLLSRIRDSLPNSIKEANGICQKRDEIIAQANAYTAEASKYAQDIMDKAEEDAKKLVEQNEIVRRAQESAQEMQQEAAGHYQKMDYDARVLAFDLLNDVEKTMRSVLKQINDRKNKLVND